MDPLSLLAELYGKGRTTAQRLRARGIHGLEDLARQSSGELGRILGTSAKSADKMLREARKMLQGNLLETSLPNKPKRIVPAPAQSVVQNPTRLKGFRADVLDELAKRFR